MVWRSVVEAAATSEVVVVAAVDVAGRVAAQVAVPPAASRTTSPPPSSHLRRERGRDTESLSSRIQDGVPGGLGSVAAVAASNLWARSEFAARAGGGSMSALCSRPGDASHRRPRRLPVRRRRLLRLVAVPEPVDVSTFSDTSPTRTRSSRACSPSTSSSRCASAPRSRGTVLERLPNLKLLVTTGMRNKSIDIEAADEHGITVCGTGSQPTATAELTWGAHPRRHPAHPAGGRLRPRRRLAARPSAATSPAPGSASSASAGSARQVARIGQAFGMDVVAWSQNLTDERAAEHGVRRVEREELFATSDVVTVHLLLVQAHPRPHRRRRLRLHEADRGLHQHEPRPDRRRAGADRRAPERHASPARASTSTTRSRCRPTTRCGRCRAPFSPRTSATSPAAPTRCSTARRSTTSRPG